MIEFSETKVGDILEITEMGAPGYAQLGDFVRVESTQDNRVDVINKDGKKANFVLTCGAQRLKKTDRIEL